MSTKYWKGEEELQKSASFLQSQKNEFPEDLPLAEVLNETDFELNANRRDFLKYFGFSVSAVALAACNTAPLRKAVPYLVKPESVTPGVADYFSSTCGGCSAGCGVEVKVREGRPIKIDGSQRSPISQGGLCIKGQASVFSLYDIERLANPMKSGAAMEDWAKVDAEIVAKLNEISTAAGRIVILTSTINSPSSLRAIADFKTKYPTAEHIVYDAVSYSGILSANLNSFGKKVVPSYDFTKASTIVSFGADFLGSWISPIEFTKQYTQNRVPTDGKEMSKHIQFESNLSLTGTNADNRFPMKASAEGAYVATLYNYIAQKAGGKQIPLTKNYELAGNSLKMAAENLWASKGSSLVISGSNDTKIQTVINGINMMLGNYGSTIDLDNNSKQYQGVDADFETLVADMNAGKVGAIMFHNANPVYNYHSPELVKGGIAKTKLSISFTGNMDETAKLVTYVCPTHHYLESWGDSEPKAGQFHFTQPVISPVFNTRQMEVSILAWAGIIGPEVDPFAGKQIMNQKFTTSPYYTYVQNTWKPVLGDLGFTEKFNECLHNGVKLNVVAAASTPSFGVDLSTLAADLEKDASNNGIDLVLFESVPVGTGSDANNPWIYETPDPVSKVCWDNYVSIPKAIAAKQGIEEGNLVDITAGNIKVASVPVIIQPGQTNNTIGLSVGYGHSVGGKVTMHEDRPVGVNAYPFYKFVNGSRTNVISNVTITKVSGELILARTQTHHSIEGRDLIREGTYSDWKTNKKAGNDKEKAQVYTLWKNKEYTKDGSPNHLWAMAIDLNACTGCSACIVSCSVENNVPIVGRKEVRRRREMHWIRIDRYYSFASNASLINKDDDRYEGEYVTKEKTIADLDAASKGEYDHYQNVKVIHQPMMCQHCAQAPCEAVCPVLATTHSTEGLNQMTYNRCIGTKYCGNNCPYKVRRFNWFRFNDNDWFDFHFNNKLGKMVINPDVTVRTRGVMEKCSFCVQKIQDGKLKAKRENRTVTDGEVKSACQRSCPANAIVFGDLHDENSEVSKLYKNERVFSVLEELNTQTAVKYLTKIRNTQKV